MKNKETGKKMTHLQSVVLDMENVLSSLKSLQREHSSRELSAAITSQEVGGMWLEKVKEPVTKEEIKK